MRVKIGSERGHAEKQPDRLNLGQAYRKKIRRYKRKTARVPNRASSERYTDEHELSGWTKGDAALAEMRDASGEWLIKYAGSREFERQPPAH